MCAIQFVIIHYIALLAKFMTTIRSSPAFWENCQKELFAMIRQIGIPTFFCSFSTAEFRWPEIISTILIQQNDTRKFSELDYNEKCIVLKSNPVTVAMMLSDRFHKFLKKVILSEAKPIGAVKDYFVREENSDRFRPRWHCIFWIDNAPQFSVDSDDRVTAFINKYICCVIPDRNDDPELFDIVSSVQQHSKNHTASCRKKGTTCRFNFPRAPSNTSFLVRIDELEDNADKSSKDHAKLIIGRLWKLLLDKNENIQTCTSLLEKAGITQEELQSVLSILASRNNVVLKRSPRDMWTNLYNPYLLRCWNANMYVLDAYSCVVYVISYISKNEKNMGQLLWQTRQEAAEGNLDARRTMKKIGSTYLNKRDVSAIESVFRMCQLPLKECSREVIFIPVGENPRRMSLPQSM